MQRAIGFPWSPAMALRARHSVGATIAAARRARSHGIAANLAGGTLHILVNNAGAISPAMFPKMTPEAFDLVLGVHVGGTFTVSQAVLPFLPDDGTGRIINVTSAASSATAVRMSCWSSRVMAIS